MSDKSSTKLAKAALSYIKEVDFSGMISANDVDKLEILDIKKYKELVKQCRFYYRRDPIAGTVINKMVEIGITPIIFDRGNLSENEMRIYEGIKDKLQEFIEACALEYLVSGLVIPEVRYGAVPTDVLKEMGVKKYNTLTLPVSMWLRDPVTIKIKTSMVLDEPSYFAVLPDELIAFIQSKGTYPDGTKDIELYQKLLTYYPEFVTLVMQGNREILLENGLITRRKVLSDSPYPLPYLYNVLEALKHKRNLRRMDYSIASRVISAIQLFKLGSDEYPVTEEDGESAFEEIRKQMMWRDSAGTNIERIFQLFANHTLKIEWVFPPVDALLNEKKYAEVNQDIFFGLGFPRILTTGETERSGSSDPEFASMSPVKTMENMQKKMIQILKGIVREIALLNKLKEWPGVRFTHINLHAFENFVDAMRMLYDTGNISRKSFAGAFGYSFDDEIRDRKEEEDQLKKMGIPAFNPQPFSPQPNSPNGNGNMTGDNDGNKSSS
jgi:hypothetical protein